MKPLKFKPKSRIREFLGEKAISLCAYGALLAILLIFVFIFKESVPLYEDEDPAWVWQPNSDQPKFSLMPLLLGTLKAALIAMLFAAPLGVLSAIYVSEFASRRTREIIKPTIELLAGLPSVVLGFFALIVLASILQDTFGLTYRLNALNAGIALGITVIPVIFTIAEDAMSAVPRSLRDAATALGATPWQVSLTMVLPAALPGIAAGIILGFGRAIGETMIVLMASGNAAIVSGSLTDSIRTFSATIAAELAEVVFGSAHYSVLFFIGTLLFIFTFIINLGGDMVLHRLKERIQGRSS
jgi:phosphate transport system permease protein